MLACGNCQAGPAALQPVLETLADGTRLQVVRCLLCGWQVERVVLGPVAVRREPRQRSGPARRYEPPPLSAAEHEAFRARMREVRLAQMRETEELCRAPGCTNLIYTLTNKLGLCNACGRRLRNYEWRRANGTTRQTEPPLYQVDGVWHWRADLAAGGGR